MNPLPQAMSEWSELLKEAMAIPFAKLAIPNHFFMRTMAGKIPIPYDQWLRTVQGEASAVLLLLAPTGPTNQKFDLLIPLTMRSRSLRRHSGQLSLPGGRCDADESPEDAASREAEEEIGILPSSYTIIGRLKRLWSGPTKTWVTPVVALSFLPVNPKITSPNEVTSIHFLHLSALLSHSQRTHHVLEKHFSPSVGGRVLMPCFFASSSQTEAVLQAPEVATTSTRWPVTECEGELVWGITALMICELVTRLGSVLSQGTTGPWAKPSFLSIEDPDLHILSRL